MSAVHTAVRPTLSLIRGMEDKTDADLVRACQREDQLAFEVLVRRHQRNVYNLFYQLAPDWNNGADMAQEVFIRAWRNIRRLRNPQAFKSWLMQIATNLFYDELRRRPKSIQIVSMDEPIDGDDGNTTRDIADNSANPDECVQRQELVDAIQRAMSELPEQFRLAIVLRDLQELSYEEIAILTKAEMGTVKSRIARARNKIQQQLAPYMVSAAS